MEKDVGDLLTRVKYLEDVTNFNQENLILTWTILGVIVGALALSGFVFIKKWVNDRTDSQLLKLKNEIINEVASQRVINVERCMAISGVQIVSLPGKVHAIMLKAYFMDERRTESCKIVKDTLMYTKNGASRDNIKIVCPNGATSEVRVKGLVENGFELEWITSGEVAKVNISFDIMVL